MDLWHEAIAVVALAVACRGVVMLQVRRSHALPVPQIALQPIVNLGTGREIAVEALSRFDHLSPFEVFERAHRDGTGPAMEAAAIRAALAYRRDGRPLSVNVSLPALLSPEVADALPHDLSGVVLEITEHSDVEDDVRFEDLLGDLRGRGARIAVDDWGRGFSNVDRVLRLQPDVVKVDKSLIRGLDSTYHRAIIRAIITWAEEVGATICAEGIETDAQWATLQALGVHTGQGYLFGHPTVVDAALGRAAG